MCAIDLEPCEVWRETVHLARRPHGCSCCGLPIGCGDPYVAHFSIFEGDVSNQALCAPCWFARAQFADAHGTTPQPGYFMELLWECIVDNGDRADPWRLILAVLLKRVRRAKMEGRA